MSLDQIDDLHQASSAHPLPERHDHEQDISLSMLSTGLSRVQDQVKFADAKGGFLATLGILLAGFVVAPASHLAASTGAAVWVVHILLGLYLVATFLAVSCVLLAVMPRLVKSQANTMTFFSHVRQQYGTDYLRYCENAKAMTYDQWAQELSAQIIAVSHIADRKHRLIHRASIWMIGSLALWIAVLAAIQFVH